MRPSSSGSSRGSCRPIWGSRRPTKSSPSCATVHRPHGRQRRRLGHRQGQAQRHPQGDAAKRLEHERSTLAHQAVGQRTDGDPRGRRQRLRKNHVHLKARQAAADGGQKGAAGGRRYVPCSGRRAAHHVEPAAGLRDRHAARRIDPASVAHIGCERALDVRLRRADHRHGGPAADAKEPDGRTGQDSPRRLPRKSPTRRTSACW